jgi:FkbM family methyltransferase
MKIFNLLELNNLIQIIDVGAAAIAEIPFYKVLLDKKFAYLHAFDGDERQIKKILEAYPNTSQVRSDFLFDGSEQTLYVASGPSGMTSLLKPKLIALKFFNGFQEFGRIEKIEKIQTRKLDNIYDMPLIDLVKMDIQGAELTVLQNGNKKLKNTVAIQLEVSYINLYEKQPSFGEVDIWMRSQGFVPHCFLEVKQWSITPTIFNNNFRIPGNQLLESDIVYIKDPLNIDLLSNDQIIKLIVIAHYSLRSYDLCVYLLIELSKRKIVPSNAQHLYLKELNNNS